MSDSELREGETPPDDWSRLLIPGIRNREEVSKLEAQNIYKAIYKYLGHTD